MKHYESFTYNNLGSVEMGVTQVSVSGGLYEDDLLTGRSVEIENTKARNIGFLKNVTKENVQLTLTLFLENGVDEDKLNKIRSWLEVDYFKPFFFDENPNKIAFLMLNGTPKINHDGINGYITIDMISHSPYWYSPYVVDEMSAAQISMIRNNGIYEVNPVIEVWATENIVSTPAKIINRRDNSFFEIYKMQKGETLRIDCENKYIKSDLPNVYRWSDCNERYLSLLVGDNQIEVQGDIEVTMKYRLVYG